MQIRGQFTSNIAFGFVAILLFAAPSAAAVAQQPASRPTTQRAAPAPAANGVAAQLTPSPSQSATANAPQRTTATYDDWIVQCETRSDTPPRKLCELTQLTQLQVQGRTQPFTRIVVPQPVKGMPSGLLVQVPVNVTFATKVKIQTSDTDSGIEAPFARCVPDGCFVEFSVGADVLTKLRAASAGGKLSFADSTGRAVAVPLSFNGFSKGYDALIKE